MQAGKGFWTCVLLFAHRHADQRAAARALVDRKLRSMSGLDPQVATRRLAGLLARKGYAAGLAFSVVREALAEHGRDPDELDDVDPWEEGDLAILADLGLPDAVLSIIVGDTDLYADEQLGMVAARLGFADELSAVLDKLGH